MAEQINYNPTPKQQFLENSKQVSAHRELMQNLTLRMSINSALLEYQNRLMVAMNDANAAAANSFKIKGALEFVDELIKLGNQVEMPKIVSRESELNHRA